MTDIHLQPEDLQEYAVSGPFLSYDGLKPLLNKADCPGTQLDGCRAFAAADQAATDGVMKTVTAGEQLLNGIRHAVGRMGERYVEGEMKTLKNLTDVAPFDKGLRPVSVGLEDALRANGALQSGEPR
jgi:hypothetical protein